MPTMDEVLSEQSKEELKRFTDEEYNKLLEENKIILFLRRHTFLGVHKKDGNLGFKLFFHNGNRHSAIDRYKQHCALTARKWLYCVHAFHNLGLEELNVQKGEIDIG